MKHEAKAARALARIAHAGQKYGMKPYFSGHIEKVVARVDSDTAAQYGHITVAYLHDIVEDTDVTLDDLRDLGFSDEVVRAVSILTRQESQTYFDYIRSVRKDTFASLVKLHDLRENLENTKYDGEASMIKRYSDAINIMESAA